MSAPARKRPACRPPTNPSSPIGYHRLATEPPEPVQAASPPSRTLAAIKLLHTAVWLFFVACIAAIPLAAAQHQFQQALAFSAAVLVECLVLAVNRGRCPLTDAASRYSEADPTAARPDNFDIYLPLWIARHNKTIFGTLFLLGELFFLTQWLLARK